MGTLWKGIVQPNVPEHVLENQPQPRRGHALNALEHVFGKFTIDHQIRQSCTFYYLHYRSMTYIYFLFTCNVPLNQ